MDDKLPENETCTVKGCARFDGNSAGFSEKIHKSSAEEFSKNTKVPPKIHGISTFQWTRLSSTSKSLVITGMIRFK